MKTTEEMWALMKDHLGYTNEQMRLFKEDPKNDIIISKAPELMQKTIVVEVVESHGCNSQHKVGTCFYLDGAGNFITKLCPKRMCTFLVGSISGMVFGMHELFYAGVDPNELKFRRTGCFDVGVQCGGWGRVVVDIRMEDRKS